MQFNKILCAIAGLALFACAPTTQPSLEPTADIDGQVEKKVIYGEDSRKDLYQVSSNLKLWADSTVALMQSSNLVDQGSSYKISGQNYGLSHNLCSSEAFREQNASAFCSGSLVAPDIIITAGHCITNTVSCSTTRFVFGYSLKSAGALPLLVNKSEVYNCKEIIKREQIDTGADYAVIRLDRAVVGHAPLAVRRSGSLNLGDNLVVIGHPSGLPVKIAGGSVRSISSQHYITNLDTYGGNSGSAVFNAVSGEIEGILVRGEQDFETQGSCNISKRCSENSCRGEDVTKVSLVLPFLPTGSQPSPVTPTPTNPTPTNPTVEYAAAVNLNVPDNNATGIKSTVSAKEAPNKRKVLVAVNIQHTYVGDLVLTLVDPSGGKTVLRNRKGGNAKNINGVFGSDLSSDSDLSKLSQVSLSGSWTLQVQDLAVRDSGVLVSWKLIFK